MDVDERILALLSEGPKSFTELANAIVPKVCAKGTLSKHLTTLENEKMIKRTLFTNRRTLYKILPKFEGKGERLHDYYTFERLISNLYSSIIDERLNLVEVKTKPNRHETWEKLAREVKPIKNVPRLRFALQCDKELSKKIAIFTQLEEISTRFKNQINSNFKELENTIPPSIKDKTSFTTFPKQTTTFDGTQTISRDVALKHNFRFLLYSWFDGKGYANRILNSLKKLKSLRRGHEDDILFLDEVCKRYYYAWTEYGIEPEDFMLDEVIPKILDGCNVNSLLEDAFWLYNWNRYDLWALEAVLISDSLCTDEKIPTLKTIFDTKEDVPYKIIDMSTYMKMKFDLLNSNDKKVILKDLLSKIGEIHDAISHNDNERLIYRVPSDKVDLLFQNLKYLMEELNVLYPQTNTEKLQNDPIFNFKFVVDGRVRDFTNIPLIKGFMKFLKDPSKRRWLQKCLETGIPIYSIIPFDKLGFTYSSIL